MYHQNKSGFIGAFISGALATVALGGYLLYGSKNARRNREKVENWAEDARDEVLRRVKRAKRLTRQKYNSIIDDISDKYAEMRDVGMSKADELREELKSYWEDIEEEARRESDAE